jgi:hypothetical protein
MCGWEASGVISRFRVPVTGSRLLSFKGMGKTMKRTDGIGTGNETKRSVLYMYQVKFEIEHMIKARAHKGGYENR